MDENREAGDHEGEHCLLEARAGCLRTKEELCAGCSREPETMRHVVTECRGVHPVCSEGDIQFLDALGCKVNGKVNRETVDISERKLECWWEKSTEEQRSQACTKNSIERSSFFL